MVPGECHVYMGTATVLSPVILFPALRAVKETPPAGLARHRAPV